MSCEEMDAASKVADGTRISVLGAEFRRFAAKHRAQKAAEIDEAEFLNLVRAGDRLAAERATAGTRDSSAQACDLADQILDLTPESVADVLIQVQVALWANGIDDQDLEGRLEDLDWNFDCAKRLRDHLGAFASAQHSQAA